MVLQPRTSWLIVCLSTCHVVVHPVEHDLWGSVPPCGDVASHFVIGVPCQTKVQDLRDLVSFEWNSNEQRERRVRQSMSEP